MKETLTFKNTNVKELKKELKKKKIKKKKKGIA